jgi:hypothetical protein
VPQSPEGKANKTKRNREYKQQRRKVDPLFVAKERAARKRHAKRHYVLWKLAREFTKTCPTKFAQFLRSKGIDNQVIRSAIGLYPSDLTPHMPVASQSSQSSIACSPPPTIPAPIPWQQKGAASLSVERTGTIPSAKQLEKGRISTADTLALLGIRLD